MKLSAKWTIILVEYLEYICFARKEYDLYGFLKYGHGDDDFLVSRANILERQSVEIEYMLRVSDWVHAQGKCVFDVHTCLVLLLL